MFVRLLVVTFGILGVIADQLTSVAAEESYPCCTQGETLQCWYMTREQCEQAAITTASVLLIPSQQSNLRGRVYRLRPPKAAEKLLKIRTRRTGKNH
jgi:hypothetical protein